MKRVVLNPWIFLVVFPHAPGGFEIPDLFCSSKTPSLSPARAGGDGTTSGPGSAAGPVGLADPQDQDAQRLKKGVKTVQ